MRKSWFTESQIADQCHIASTGDDPVGWHRAGQSRFVHQRHAGRGRHRFSSRGSEFR